MMSVDEDFDGSLSDLMSDILDDSLELDIEDFSHIEIGIEDKLDIQGN